MKSSKIKCTCVHRFGRTGPEGRLQTTWKRTSIVRALVRTRRGTHGQTKTREAWKTGLTGAPLTVHVTLAGGRDVGTEQLARRRSDAEYRSFSTCIDGFDNGGSANKSKRRRLEFKERDTYHHWKTPTKLLENSVHFSFIAGQLRKFSLGTGPAQEGYKEERRDADAFLRSHEEEGGRDRPLQPAGTSRANSPVPSWRPAPISERAIPHPSCRIKGPSPP